MRWALIEEKFVDHYAQASGVDSLVAERDIVLTFVLRILRDHLPGKLAFKGGTCLKKIYVGKTGRFSMDLDFTAVHITPKSLREKFAALLLGEKILSQDAECTSVLTRTKSRVELAPVRILVGAYLDLWVGIAGLLAPEFSNAIQNQ